jgi:hypothetical protein
MFFPFCPVKVGILFSSNRPHVHNGPRFDPLNGDEDILQKVTSVCIGASLNESTAGCGFINLLYIFNTYII